MVYLKNLNSQVRGYKDTDSKTVNEMIDSGRWVRVKGLKDTTPYVNSKVKKKSKKKSKKVEE